MGFIIWEVMLKENTVLPASKFVVDCWIEFYFLVAMKTKDKKPDEGAGEEFKEENRKQTCMNIQSSLKSF